MIVNNTLYHHGIKGQKWGIRRYQNPDGTWTDAGKKRYGNSEGVIAGAESKASNNTKKKVEPKQVLESAVKSASATVSPKLETKQFLEKVSTAVAPISQTSTPKVSVNKPPSEIPQTYSFESLIRQNDDLLKKMLAESA